MGAKILLKPGFVLVEAAFQSYSSNSVPRWTQVFYLPPTRPQTHTRKAFKISLKRASMRIFFFLIN